MARSMAVRDKTRYKSGSGKKGVSSFNSLAKTFNGKIKKGGIKKLSPGMKGSKAMGRALSK